MNTRSFHSNPIRHLGIMSVGLWLLACATTVSGADKTNPPTAPAPGATNTGAKLPAIAVPTSQFTIPTSSTDGRNPFFPESVLTKFKQNANTNTTGKVTSVALDLKGISGTGTKRFALINNRTFEPGEDGDVTVGRSKVHVLCISIREESVTIEVDGNRQELKLRPGL